MPSHCCRCVLSPVSGFAMAVKISQPFHKEPKVCFRDMKKIVIRLVVCFQNDVVNELKS